MVEMDLLSLPFFRGFAMNTFTFFLFISFSLHTQGKIETIEGKITVISPFTTLNISHNNNFSTSKEVEPINPQPPSMQFSLLRESLYLNFSVFETYFEFTVSSSKLQNENVKSTVKRILLVFETDHPNVDVISISVEGVKGRNFIFSKAVEDLAWNRRSGTIISDEEQNYKCTSHNSSTSKEENGTFSFITCQRQWLTCDINDIQFKLSPFKIWWFLDSSLSQARNYENVETNKLLEKQIEEVEVLRTIKADTFQGPLLVSLNDMLLNHTVVQIRSCDTGSSLIGECDIADISNFEQDDVLKDFAISRIYFPPQGLFYRRTCKLTLPKRKNLDFKPFLGLKSGDNRCESLGIVKLALFLLFLIIHT